MSQFRIIRIAPLHYWPPKIQLYADNPGLEEASYEAQQQKLFEYHFVYGNGFSNAMHKLGHEASEIVYDLEPMQRQWANENDVQFDEKDWQTDILLAQIAKIKPDVIYFQDIHSLPFDIRKNLKDRFPFLRVIAVFRGYPGINDTLLNELATADVLFVGSPIIYDFAKQANLNVHLNYHFFDKAILEDTSQIKLDRDTYDLTFAGSSGYGYGESHRDRYESLLQLLLRTNIHMWLDERESIGNRKTPQRTSLNDRLKISLRNYLKLTLEGYSDQKLNTMCNSKIVHHKIKYLAEEVLSSREPETPHCLQKSVGPSVRLKELFPGRIQAPVFGLGMYRVLAQSKITFNLHSNAAQGTVDNIRMFQATGMGACLLTDDGRNMKDLFEPDKEIVTYTSVDECVEKVQYLLDHEDERMAIAKAGQRRTLKDHTVLKRCMKVDEEVQKLLAT